MGLGGLTTQLQRQVGIQIAKLIIFAPPRVNLNKRNSIHPYSTVHARCWQAVARYSCTPGTSTGTRQGVAWQNQFKYEIWHMIGSHENNWF